MLIPAAVKVRICSLHHQAPTSSGPSFGRPAGVDVCPRLLFSARQFQLELQGNPVVLLPECLHPVQEV